MIGELPEGDFILMAGQSSHFDVDCVVANNFVPRLELHQHLTSLVFCLPRFVYFDAGRWRYQVTAGLLAKHRAA